MLSFSPFSLLLSPYVCAPLLPFLLWSGACKAQPLTPYSLLLTPDSLLLTPDSLLLTPLERSGEERRGVGRSCKARAERRKKKEVALYSLWESRREHRNKYRNKTRKRKKLLKKKLVFLATQPLWKGKGRSKGPSSRRLGLNYFKSYSKYKEKVKKLFP